MKLSTSSTDQFFFLYYSVKKKNMERYKEMKENGEE